MFPRLVLSYTQFCQSWRENMLINWSFPPRAARSRKFFLLVGGSNVVIIQRPIYNDNEMGVGCLVRDSNDSCHFECYLKSIKLQKEKVVVCSIILLTTYSNANITPSLYWTSTSLEFKININHWRTYQEQGHRRRKC